MPFDFALKEGDCVSLPFACNGTCSSGQLSCEEAWRTVRQLSWRPCNWFGGLRCLTEGEAYCNCRQEHSQINARKTLHRWGAVQRGWGLLSREALSHFASFAPAS